MPLILSQRTKQTDWSFLNGTGNFSQDGRAKLFLSSHILLLRQSNVLLFSLQRCNKLPGYEVFLNEVDKPPIPTYPTPTVLVAFKKIAVGPKLEMACSLALGEIVPIPTLELVEVIGEVAVLNCPNTLFTPTKKSRKEICPASCQLKFPQV